MPPRPIVEPSQRVPAPVRGVPALLRVLAVAQVVIAAGALADWGDGGFIDATKLVSGVGFALMAPWNWMAARGVAGGRMRLWKACCLLGLALALGAMLWRWL